jgi:choline dehydrogenase-like flavoprotein
MGEVVDGQGRVYGVDALRVADTSILPAVPSRGTFNAAVFIGEFIAHQMRKTR